MGFQKGVGQGFGFCSGCALFVIAVPLLLLGGGAKWISDVTRTPPPAAAVRSTPRPTPRPTPTAKPDPSFLAWRTDVCTAISKTTDAGKLTEALSLALRYGDMKDFRTIGRAMKETGQDIMDDWRDVNERSPAKKMRATGITVGRALRDIGTGVLYAVDHTETADANGLRLVGRVKDLNANLKAHNDAFEAFTDTQPRPLCA